MQAVKQSLQPGVFRQVPLKVPSQPLLFVYAILRSGERFSLFVRRAFDSQEWLATPAARLLDIDDVEVQTGDELWTALNWLSRVANRVDDFPADALREACSQLIYKTTWQIASQLK
jgi:hypothetical protein